MTAVVAVELNSAEHQHFLEARAELQARYPNVTVTTSHLLRCAVRALALARPAMAPVAPPDRVIRAVR